MYNYNASIKNMKEKNKLDIVYSVFALIKWVICQIITVYPSLGLYGTLGRCPYLSLSVCSPNSLPSTCELEVEKPPKSFIQ